jgi:hypothetical protein
MKAIISYTKHNKNEKQRVKSIKDWIKINQSPVDMHELLHFRERGWFKELWGIHVINVG